MLADCLNVPLSDAIVRSDHMSDDVEAVLCLDTKYTQWTLT